MTYNELRNLLELLAITSWNIPVKIKDENKLYDIKVHLSEDNSYYLEIEKIDE